MDAGEDVGPLPVLDKGVIGCQGKLHGGGDVYIHTSAEIQADVGDASRHIIGKIAYSSRMEIPARVIDTRKREDVGALFGHREKEVHIHIEPKGIASVATEHIVDVGGDSQQAIEAIGKFYPGGRLAVKGVVAGQDAEGFFSGVTIRMTWRGHCRGDDYPTDGYPLFD